MNELLYAEDEPGQDHRALGMLDPLWNALDITPEGRGNFQVKLKYVP